MVMGIFEALGCTLARTQNRLEFCNYRPAGNVSEMFQPEELLSQTSIFPGSQVLSTSL